MRTVTVDIINEKVLNLLRDLEQLQLIRLRKDSATEQAATLDWVAYKGAMSKQPLNEIDQQLNELRSEWE